MNDDRSAARAIAEAEHLLISAGAGMGVDSGLPDFRGNEGFWRAYPPYRKLGLPFTSMANPSWFAQDPELGWGFYGHRLQLYRETEPHPGFELLLSWALSKKSYFVFTSNVDGQFQKAGFAAERIFEVHGSIHHLQCSRPCNEAIYSADGTTVELDTATMRALPPLPSCPSCGAMARPNVLMFGDWSFLSGRDAEQNARYQQWLGSLEGPLTVIELGAGGAVPTVRLEGEALVRSLGARLVRINPREPQVPAGGISLAEGALAALQQIAHGLV